MDEPRMGAKVHDVREDGSTWRIVSVEEDEIGLSGPGPCRSMRYVDQEEFEEFWEEVE